MKILKIYHDLACDEPITWKWLWPLGRAFSSTNRDNRVVSTSMLVSRSVLPLPALRLL